MPSPLRPDSDAAPFTHPADSMDGDDTPTHSVLPGGVDAEDVFRRLFHEFLPVGPYKGGRRWRAGYNRMVACAYIVAPEVLGGMSQEEVAKQLGLNKDFFRRLLREVEATLASRARASRPRIAGPKRN